MPVPRTWLARSKEILSILREIPDHSLDRPAIEKLFELQKRTALLLMKAVGPSSSGTSFLVDRDKLIRWVEAIERTEGQEVERRRRVVEKIDAEMGQYRALRQALKERGTPAPQFPVLPEALGARIDELPPDIQVTTGKVVILVPSLDALEACSLFHALGLVITGDFEGFERRLTGGKNGSKVSS